MISKDDPDSNPDTDPEDSSRVPSEITAHRIGGAFQGHKATGRGFLRLISLKRDLNQVCGIAGKTEGLQRVG